MIIQTTVCLIISNVLLELNVTFVDICRGGGGGGVHISALYLNHWVYEQVGTCISEKMLFHHQISKLLEHQNQIAAFRSNQFQISSILCCKGIEHQFKLYSLMSMNVNEYAPY